jgi:F0F1-type ATP synthase membrane subunit a
MRKRTTDVTLALIVFILCCLLSFFQEGGDEWMRVLVAMP